VGSWRQEPVTLRFGIPRIDDVGDKVFRGWPGESTGNAKVFGVDVVGGRRRPSLRTVLESLPSLLTRMVIR
jgi:hypothetical protein